MRLWTDASNSYIYSGGTGAANLILNNTGKVGLGTTSPSSPLHIKSNTNRTIKLDFTGIGNGASYTWQSLTTNSVEQWRIVGRDDDNANLEFWNKTSDKVLTFLQNGNIGVGTNEPIYGRLQIDQTSDTSDKGIGILNSTGARAMRLWTDANNSYVYSGGTGQANLILNNSGNVGIGTTSPQSKLAVDGQIRATEVKVLADISVPDYVFEPDYELRTLKETKEYISENKHLPEIPSASEIGENGIDLGDMNMRLLKKIEELTLYQIELLERIEELEKKVEEK